jgi:hypothetical protein
LLHPIIFLYSRINRAPHSRVVAHREAIAARFAIFYLALPPAWMLVFDSQPQRLVCLVAHNLSRGCFCALCGKSVAASL